MKKGYTSVDIEPGLNVLNIFYTDMDITSIPINENGPYN